MEPTLEPTVASNDTMTTTAQRRRAMANTNFFTTEMGGGGRKLLQTSDDVSDYIPNENETCAEDFDADLYTYTTFFPPRCDLTLCATAARDTNYVNFTEGSLLIFFDSEDDLEDYITSSVYGDAGFTFANDADNGAQRPIGAAIVFTETGGDDGKTWAYKLRFNSTSTPSTEDGGVDKFTRNNGALYEAGLKLYLESSAFPWLQTWIDEGIMEHVIEQEYGDSAEYELKMAELTAKTNEYSKGVFQFASYPYKEDNFWLFAGGLFGFFLFIMFSYPLITVISILVEEKRSKIKEGMKMMGATTSAYW